MRHQANRGIQLPRTLLDQLGVDSHESSRQSKTYTSSRSRKDRRKAARVEKKTRNGPSHVLKQARLRNQRSHQQEPELSSKEFDTNVTVGRDTDRTNALETTLTTKRSSSQAESDSENFENGKRQPRRTPKAKEQQLADDDAEIEMLEKALGLKKKKGQARRNDDGLDDLLGDLGATEGSRRESQGDEVEWLKQKRQKALSKEYSDPKGAVVAESASLDMSDFDAAETARDPEEGDLDIESSDMDFEEFDEEMLAPTRKMREDPYKAPAMTSEAREPAKKYVPPSLRHTASSEDEFVKRLRRQIRGLLNRLSESNMLSILSDLERIYGDNPRHMVSSTLLGLWVDLICSPDSLQDTFVVLHSGFMAAVYKVVGVDFGAQAIERLIDELEKHRAAAVRDSLNGKTLSNLVSFVAELFNFQMIGCALVYDFVRIFVADINELHTELLLKIVRHCGAQMRQEDPSSLKDIVLRLHSAVKEIGEKNLSVRTRFMIEIIDSLKNNKLKTNLANSTILSEHTIRVKKIVGSLHTRSLKAIEPLQVTLDDIRNGGKRGKWWLVGASYREKARKNEGDDLDHRFNSTSLAQPHEGDFGLGDQNADLLQLAKEQRMNTDIRRAIFITIMSAADFKDAHHRLIKLKLKRAQELEIPKIILHCAMGEEKTNPYYTMISRQLCADRKFKMAFQFALWDMFKRMGEASENPIDTGIIDEMLGMRQIVNLARMYGSLVADGGVGLSILKNLNLPYLQRSTRTFVEVLVITIILESQRGCSAAETEQTLTEMISSIQEFPALVEGLRVFLRKLTRTTDLDLVSNERDKKKARWACTVMQDALATKSSQSR